MMPITKPIIGTHSCWPPSPTEMVSHGYLPGTEWTCEVCDAVLILEVAGPGFGWVDPTAPVPVPENPLVDDPVEVEPEVPQSGAVEPEPEVDEPWDFPVAPDVPEEPPTT